MKNQAHRSDAGNGGGSAVLVACFVAALVLHALMVPVMGGALGLSLIHI